MSELLLMVRRDSDPEDQWTPLAPDSFDFQVPENESLTLEFRGPNAQRLGRQHLEYIGDLQQLQAGWARFSWRPFADGRTVAYGWQRLRVRPPPAGRPLDFHVRIIPSLLNVEQWQFLFEDVRRVADALVTKWLNPQNTRLGGVALPTSKFSPATAMAEMQDEWKEFAASLNRIIRAPRTEFRAPRPGVPREDPDSLPEPVRDADIYENALVALTVERLGGTLRRIERRAQSTMEDANRTRDIYKDVFSYSGGKKGEPKVKRPHAAVEEAQHIYESSQRMAATAHERAQFLQRARRQLPGRPAVASSRGHIPHVTPRVRHHPDYNRIIRWYRAFGHQKLAFSTQQFLSALGAQRASTLYEYWCLLAMFSALMELGFTPRYQELTELVREDVIDLKLWSDRAITFTREESGEKLSIWYERQARFLPGRTTGGSPKTWSKDVKEAAATAPAGLYSREGPKEPDFWFELRQEDRVAVAVGDAIFSEGIDTSAQATDKFMSDKMNKVSKYAKDLVLIDGQGRHWFPMEQGLVVFCGNTGSLEQLNVDNSTGHTLLPLRPLTEFPKDPARPSIPLDPQCVQLFEGFLNELREALRGPS
jgi:hypothetical protein